MTRTLPVTLALSPKENNVLLAAASLGLWHELIIVGQKHIHPVAAQWHAEAKPRRVWLLLDRVNDPASLRALLAALQPSGVELEWYAPEGEPSVLVAAQGLPHVHLIPCDPAGAAFMRRHGRHRVPVDVNQNRDLTDYLRYKITLSFMAEMDPQPLIDAARVLARHGSRSFRLRESVPEDAASVEHFREADFPYIEGRSEPILALKRRIRQVARSDLNVLIVGETGTGKEFTAFYLHEFSARRAKPYEAINCAGLDEGFLRSELFGHIKGAFTGATANRQGLLRHANGGTLFLDEVGDMPIAIQADLLRAIETRQFRPLGDEKMITVDVRFIAGAQPAIDEKLQRGDFRDDFFYRLCGVRIDVPPLRHVPDDVLRIVRHVCYRIADRQSLAADDVQATIDYFRQGEALLRAYPWPGNVRELIGLVRRRVALGDDVLQELARKLDDHGAAAPLAVEASRTLEPVRKVTARYVQRAWQRRGSMTQQQLAARLGISVNTLKRYLRTDAGPNADSTNAGSH